MKVISVILILVGLYLMFTDDSDQKKTKPYKIEYKGKYQHQKEERLVEIIDPKWDIKYPKRN